MKEIKVVIGANFGDEGKGLMTDYYCGTFRGPVLNVRFNATCQAGHTVEREAKRHVFSHFGAGSFLPNVVTFLSSDFYFNPIGFFREREELEEKGIKPKVYLSRKAEAITLYDVLFNCMLEESRGEARHGSCGAGLWEAVNRQKAGYDLTAKDLEEPREVIREKLLKIRDEYYAARFAEMGLNGRGEGDWHEVWYSSQALENYLELFFRMKTAVTVVDETEILNAWDQQVYEGAQGLLLDWGNREYMPNLTASYTGSKNVARLLTLIKDPAKVEICYVTRTYFTRHGAGRFETETAKENLDDRLVEETNVTNRWQGSFRWGYFDEPLFLKTIQRDHAWLDGCTDKEITRCIAFTHTDKTDEELLLPGGREKIDLFVRKLPKEYRHFYSCLGKEAGNVERRMRSFN